MTPPPRYLPPRDPPQGQGVTGAMLLDLQNVELNIPFFFINYPALGSFVIATGSRLTHLPHTVAIDGVSVS